MSDSRLEKFIYAICSMDVSDLPVPLSRIETLWNCLITGETPDFEPLSRNEKYLMAMLDRYDISNLPAPMSRGEKLLYKIAVGETDLSDVPGYLSRYEELLKYLIENGGIGFEYVLHTLNQSLSTLYNTAEKPVKSAILKGQTLVNIVNFEKSYFRTTGTINSRQGCIINFSTATTGKFNLGGKISLLKTDTEYLLKVKLECENKATTYVYLLDEDNNKYIMSNTSIKDNNYSYKFTTPSTLGNTIKLGFIRTADGGKETITASVLLIEHQEGMENWDIPYFTDMQSVKMPVLTTTGKNLFNNEFTTISNYNNQAYSKVNVNKFIGVNGNFTISVLESKSKGKIWFNLYINGTEKFNLIVNGATNNKKYTFLLNEQNQVEFGVYSEGISKQQALEIIKNDFKIQLELGTVATSYEPYKSNILTVNEDVELRGIGDVRDELNCLTGELTERISEIVLDGSEDWKVRQNKTNTISFHVDNLPINAFTDYANANEKMVCNKLIPFFGDNYDDREYIMGKATGKGIIIGMFKTKVSGLSDFKEYLANNNIILQYQLAEPIVKTVDLTTVDQDGQPTKLKTFNDITYVEIKADNLIPSVDLEVATKINEALSTMGLQHHDISETQNKLGQTIDEQTENTDATMMATTEIYEQTL